MAVMLSATMFGFVNLSHGIAIAAEQIQPAKKPKTKTDTKTAPSKTAKPRFQTAETAGKATACFGTVPKIEKISPDEGKAGDKVTITGTNFGAVECLRSVSFGPGHEGKFQMDSATKITTTVPSGGRKGLALLTVTTASGEDTKPFLMK
jgi:hypothetical protein